MYHPQNIISIQHVLETTGKEYMDKNDPNSARLRFGIACFQAIQILRKETTGHRHELSPKTGLKVSFKPNASRCYAMGLVSTHNFMKYFGNQF